MYSTSTVFTSRAGCELTLETKGRQKRMKKDPMIFTDLSGGSLVYGTQDTARGDWGQGRLLLVSFLICASGKESYSLAGSARSGGSGFC